MKRTIIIVALIGTTNLFAQTQNDNQLINEITAIQKTIEKQKQEIDALSSKIGNQQTSINQQRNSINDISNKASMLEKTTDSLSRLIETNRSNITSIADDLGTRIQETGQQAETRISELGGDVEKNRLYWIIASLVTLLLGALMYLFLGKRIKSSQTDVETQIRNTKKSLEEESLKLDNKLIEVLETQMKVQQEESRNQPIATNEKADHSLALKVADEIVRMQKNISRMDADIKGLKPLEKGIERIQANFAANGYEMVNLLNSEYDERMNIDVINFVEDDTLESGKKLISKIIKPQINFNGILIQRAQVEVSQN
jgi:chromosome segregation ATPase